MRGDKAIELRLHRARLHLSAAVDDVVAASRRVQKWNARIARLEAALRTPEEVRQERARKAVATRRRPKLRAMEIV